MVCSLPTGDKYEEVTWTLLPVVVAAQFDTKERDKFFGNRAERACAICSGPRKGRSSFRRGTPHASRWLEIQQLQKVAQSGDMRKSSKKRKRVSLVMIVM